MGGAGRESTPEADLRRRAEALLDDPKAAGGDGTHRPGPEEGELRSTLHELQVHRAELELQNESLREVQRDLEASLDRYEDLYDFAPVGYVTTSEADLITAANLTLARMLQCEREQLLGEPITRFFVVDDQPLFVAHRRQCLATGTGGTCRLRIRRSDGEERWVRLESVAEASSAAARSGEAAPGSDGRALRSAFSDITEQMRARAAQERLEARMAHSRTLESLGVLAGGVAHDFNNLLLAVRANAELVGLALRDDPVDPNELDGMVEQIIDATRRGEAHVAKLLAYVGKGLQTTGPLDLEALATSVVQELGATNPSKLTLVLGRGGSTFMGDESQVRQIVLSLVTNGLDAIRAGRGEAGRGTVTVATGARFFARSELAEGRVTGEGEPGEYAFVQVADTGSGMTEAVLEKAFEPFFSTRFPGRGLGLAAVQGTVRRYGGEILIETVVGQGTTVTVLFPIGSGRAVDPEAAGTAGPPAGGGRRPRGDPPIVLVVDDDDSVRRLCERMLTRVGFRVCTASDGEGALALVRDGSTPVDCVLLDLNMPGIGGAATCAELQRTEPELPVVLMSGFDEAGLPPSVGDGRVRFLKKPFRIETLQSMIQDALD